MKEKSDYEDFLTPQQHLAEQASGIESPRGRLLIASCRSGAALAGEVVRRYEQLLVEAGAGRGVPYLADADFDFSDGETGVRLEADVNGHDVFLFQALHDPTVGRGVDANYVAFMVAARALREWGASHVTAVLPYLAYARQDKPTKFEREPTTAKLMADLSVKAGIDRLVVWNPHTDRIHGFYGSVPVDALSPLALYADVFRRFQGRDDVIAVAPDAGVAKYVIHFARALDISTAVASKHRPKPEQAVITEIMGDFAGKRVAIVVDDMISSGGTVSATVKRLVGEKGIAEVYLGISHNLCTKQALARLSELYADYCLRELIVTDSVPQTEAFQALPFLQVRTLADPLSRVINRIHHNRSVDGILAQPLVADGE
jgi:ribose-phosphate pyrophosphokinase